MAARASKQTPPDEENVWYTATKLDRSDLSPLTRGKPRPSSTRRRALRLISAHTGKTPRLSDRSCHVTAHPRSREENIDAWQLPERHVGSSPLTRGKRTLRVTAGILRRLIPAHAGKTVQAENPNSQHRAHPRSRGENGRIMADTTSGAGSSPLTRGKLEIAIPDPRVARLIPAHAGKTPDDTSIHTSVQAHPRSRGENQILDLVAGKGRGSSPLTRGKLSPTPTVRVLMGLIPAHAGKTPTGWDTLLQP